MTSKLSDAAIALIDRPVIAHLATVDSKSQTPDHPSLDRPRRWRCDRQHG